MLDVLFAPIVFCMRYPAAALGPAIGFAACALRKKPRHLRWVIVAAALTWFAYAVYEWRMQIWGASQIAPIRVDMFLVAPVLYGMTGVGLWAVLTPPA